MFEKTKLKTIRPQRVGYEEKYQAAQNAFLAAMRSRDVGAVGKTARQLAAALEEMRCQRRTEHGPEAA